MKKKKALVWTKPRHHITIRLIGAGGGGGSGKKHIPRLRSLRGTGLEIQYDPDAFPITVTVGRQKRRK
jgi:hypothetical protein